MLVYAHCKWNMPKQCIRRHDQDLQWRSSAAGWATLECKRSLGIPLASPSPPSQTPMGVFCRVKYLALQAPCVELSNGTHSWRTCSAPARVHPGDLRARLQHAQACYDCIGAEDWPHPQWTSLPVMSMLRVLQPGVDEPLIDKAVHVINSDWSLEWWCSGAEMLSLHGRQQPACVFLLRSSSCFQSILLIDTLHYRHV